MSISIRPVAETSRFLSVRRQPVPAYRTRRVQLHQPVIERGRLATSIPSYSLLARVWSEYMTHGMTLPSDLAVHFTIDVLA